MTSYNLIWQLDSTLTWIPKSNFPGPSRKFAAGYTVGCNTYIIGGQNHTASNVPPNTNLIDFWKSECNTLPITLLDFEVECATEENPSLNVNWHTAAESNCKSFLLRLEIDGKLYEKELAAKGNSNQVSSYHTSFSISKSVGLNPARVSLIELDLDGNYATILTQSISCQLPTSAILSVYPNPFSGGEFMLENSSINPKLIKIIDAVGHELNFSYTYLNQNLHIRLEANNLPGLYYLLYQGAFTKIVLLP